LHILLKKNPKTNKFIYEKNLEIQERKALQIKQQQIQSKIQQSIQPNQTLRNQNLQINSSSKQSSDREIFKLQKVRGDGNCAIRAILESIGIKQEQHPIFREALAEDANNTEFDQQILDDKGFKSKHNLITYLKIQNYFLGMDHILLLIEKHNININIWLDNQINGLKWLKLSEKDSQNQPKLYVNYKDHKGIFPDKL